MPVWALGEARTQLIEDLVGSSPVAGHWALSVGDLGGKL